MYGRCVTCRASRIAKRFASVAVSANCQCVDAEATGQLLAHPQRVLARQHRRDPAAACSAIARSVGSGAWPDIAPVSPRQKSTYSRPSTSTKRAPCASRTKTGKPPGHFGIQCIGTPANEVLARARPARASAVCLDEPAPLARRQLRPRRTPLRSPDPAHARLPRAARRLDVARRRPPRRPSAPGRAASPARRRRRPRSRPPSRRPARPRSRRSSRRRRGRRCRARP